jgi:hypothetical protein
MAAAMVADFATRPSKACRPVAHPDWSIGVGVGTAGDANRQAGAVDVNANAGEDVAKEWPLQ